jgi:hypothetical protein
MEPYRTWDGPSRGSVHGESRDTQTESLLVFHGPCITVSFPSSPKVRMPPCLGLLKRNGTSIPQLQPHSYWVMVLAAIWFHLGFYSWRCTILDMVTLCSLMECSLFFAVPQLRGWLSTNLPSVTIPCLIIHGSLVQSVLLSFPFVDPQSYCITHHFDLQNINVLTLFMR